MIEPNEIWTFGGYLGDVRCNNDTKYDATCQS